MIIKVIFNNMNTLFILLSFVALIALAIGLVRPSILKLQSRKKVLMWYGGGLIVIFILIGATAPATSTPTPVVSAPVQAQSNPTTTTQTQPAPKVSNSASQVQAQKDLDDLMALSKKAGLVHSYEFSNTAHVIYVDSVWYTQDVQFKKDFLAKVTTLRATIVNNGAGWDWFEVKDAYSNEKVAEVTAFSGSLEVYK